MKSTGPARIEAPRSREQGRRAQMNAVGPLNSEPAGDFTCFTRLEVGRQPGVKVWEGQASQEQQHRNIFIWAETSGRVSRETPAHQLLGFRSFSTSMTRL